MTHPSGTCVTDPGPGDGPRPPAAGVGAVAPSGARPGAPLLLFGASWMRSSPRLLLAARGAELGGGVTVVVVTLVTGSTGAVGVVGLVLSVGAWVACILVGDRPRPVAVALVVMAAAGGLASAERGPGVVFVGVAASGAAFAFDLPVAVVLTSPSLVTFLIVALDRGTVPSRPWMLGAIALLGSVSGGGRRRLLELGEQSGLLATAEDRATVARRESELMAERNRLGRDLHDVLAHTLGAVSIQLTALDARVAAGDAAQAVRARIASIHGLVGEGLVEARAAVRALREDGPTLTAHVGRLCGLHGAALAIDGPVRPLGPEPSLTLYRVAQEALTNADKHAPRSGASVRVTFTANSAAVTVDNGRPETGAVSRLAASGGGQGLAGLRERVELAGGTFGAGPTGDGWRVTAELPC